MTQTTLSKVDRIESRIDNTVTQALAVSGSVGGLAFKNMDEVMNFAKLMAISDVAVPRHIRENVGACLAVVIQAVEWRMSPYAVANKSYVVNDRLAFESQLIHAVIEQRAPIQGRLRNRYTGEGDSRRCIVWGTPKGETQPLEYQSPETRHITPKNSPLWKTKPDLQLFYNASRDWARMYYPDVIMGVYAEDELDELPATIARASVPMPRALGEPAPAPAGQPTEEEANRIIEQAAEKARTQHTSSSAAEPVGDNDRQAGGEEVQTEPEAEAPEGDDEHVVINGNRYVKTLPDKARQAVGFVDEAVLMLKPTDITAKAARETFHAMHKPSSWHTLAPEVQDQLWTSLLNGEVFTD